MERHAPGRSDEVESVYQRTLPVVHQTLISYYRLTEEEAVDAERDLYVWFHRLSRRGSAGQVPARGLRLSLLSAACQYGRSFQIWKLGGTSSVDDGLNMILAREAGEVAADLVGTSDEDSL